MSGIEMSYNSSYHLPLLALAKALVSSFKSISGLTYFSTLLASSLRCADDMLESGKPTWSPFCSKCYMPVYSKFILFTTYYYLEIYPP